MDIRINASYKKRLEEGGLEKDMRIRDPIVGDIQFNKLEEYCIKTPTFQRLHRIKQLGNAFHVYPGAMHTRFEHSLGVCYQVQRMLSHLDFYKHCPDTTPNSDDDCQVIRLAALLHDITHTPYKHTLDRDSRVVPEPSRQREYEARIDQISSEIKSLFGENFPEEQKSMVLTLLKSSKGTGLDKPYYKQIIEDTLSADLLDYSLRDCYYTGLQRKWDSRIYDHIAVANYNKKPHIVANIIGEDGKTAQSAITEIINLIDIRYTLNERVYFYAPKIGADSLLVKSARQLFTTTNFTHGKFIKLNRDISDEELINFLIKKPKYDKVNYAQLLRDRRLPKLALELDGEKITYDEQCNIAKNCSGHNCYEKWSNLENDIAKEAGVPADDVIIYCHDLQMQAKKKPEFLILYNENREPCPIEGYTQLKSEINHIADKHEHLWRCYVFSIDTDKTARDRIEIAAKDVLKSLN